MCIANLYKNDFEQVNNLLWNLRKEESVKIFRLDVAYSEILNEDINLIISNIVKEFKKRIDYSVEIDGKEFLVKLNILIFNKSKTINIYLN